MAAFVFLSNGSVWALAIPTRSESDRVVPRLSWEFPPIRILTLKCFTPRSDSYFRSGRGFRFTPVAWPMQSRQIPTVLLRGRG
jgi:hypothetical protein